VSTKRQIEEMIIELGEPIADAHGHDLVDAEYMTGEGRPRILVTLDKPGGVSIGDCQKFSNLLGARLDLEEDKLPDGYYLEVSSPGLDRSFRRDREFDIFRGRNVHVRTYAPVNGRKEFYGKLEGLHDDEVLIMDEEEGVSHAIPHDMVARCKLHYEIDDLM